MQSAPAPSEARASEADASADANLALTLLPEAGTEPKLPPYDLGADLVARDADAHKRLGKGIETAVVGGVFVFVGARGYTGAPFAQSRDLVTRALAAFDNGRFGKRPAEAITVYLFPDDRTYGAFCKAALGQACISIYGFYWPRDRWMVMNADWASARSPTSSCIPWSRPISPMLPLGSMKASPPFSRRPFCPKPAKSTARRIGDCRG